jgi:NitT/TauT family transport system ATP-binding protein
MSDKEASGAVSLADLLKRGPAQPAGGQPPRLQDVPPEAKAVEAETAAEAAPEDAPSPTRLEVEVVDLEPDEWPAKADEARPVAAAMPKAPVPESVAPAVALRKPLGQRGPGWLSSAGGKSPVSGEAASAAYNRALAGEMLATVTAATRSPGMPEEAAVGHETAVAVGHETAVIDIKRLELTFLTNDGPVEALADINLTVGRGEFISLIGPSGCGKTTLLRVIADLEHATSGTVLVNGVTPEQARLARAYGYVFQAPALYPWRTIAKNVALPLEIMGLGVIEREDRIARNLELVNLTGFERKYPWQLSGGMQQRASIARALAVEPDLLLMDEPFGALDEIVRDHLNQQLLELWSQTNKTVVFVTHSIPEAVFLSTRIVVMTPRPCKIHDIIESTLPRNRNLDIRETPEFLKIAHRVRQGLRAGHSYED